MPTEPPLAFFITFTTYGTWLRHRSAGSVDHTSNQWNTPRLAAMCVFEAAERRTLKEDPFLMSEPLRQVVGTAIRGVCEHRGWDLGALNVRSNHVHAVVGSHDVKSPEFAMNQFKIWATRQLRSGETIAGRKRVWTRHGSTLWLFRPDDVTGAIDYVLNHQ